MYSPNIQQTFFEACGEHTWLASPADLLASTLAVASTVEKPGNSSCPRQSLSHALLSQLKSRFA